MRLNVGCGKDVWDGDDDVNLDLPGNPLLGSMDIAGDVTDTSTWKLAGTDLGWLIVEQFDDILCSHVIEHVLPVAGGDLLMMENLWRVAKPGAICMIRCPHGASDDAFDDPTHVRQIFPNRFHYYDPHAYWRADYGYRGDWKLKSLELVVEEFTDGRPSVRIPPSSHYELSMTRRNHVLEMVAVLEAVKPAREPQKEAWPMPLTISVGGGDPAP